jgi:hypothetical protein
MTRPTRVGAGEAAIKWITTSVSDVDWKIDPRASSCSRSASAFTRLPLWAMANAPCAHSTTKGWQFFRTVDPVVE